ncbi:hypothetical protein ABE288_06155 [Bacillus salipaludis]|uniref:hypothetical protein n=1 Tax=Bacillus salipaludis TaxID=2547811 RepID=UPI003D1B1FF9
MLKVYSKKTISTILASSLVFGLGTAVVSAAPNTNNSVTTGRTEQNVATGVITPDKIPALAHGVTDVTLTGTVVIDGPQLVLVVGNKDVSSQATLTKVADKTWTYKYKTNVGNETGDVTFNIGAYTIYTNGKPAGQTHTTATTVGQTVHVPFVKSYDYTSLNWTGYDRTANEFTFSYNLVKVWDDGVREVVTNPVNAKVSGTETYQDSGFTITPPKVFRDFTFSTDSPVWTYNAPIKAYNVSFAVNESWSNGETATETITRDGLTPGAANEVSVTINEVTHTTSLTAPAAPAPVIPSSVTGTVDASKIQSLWTGNNANGGNVQEAYTLTYTINGVSFTQNLSNNFTKSGTNFNDQVLTYKAIYNGQTVVVNYTLPYIAPTGTTNNN